MLLFRFYLSVALLHGQDHRRDAVLVLGPLDGLPLKTHEYQAVHPGSPHCQFLVFSIHNDSRLGSNSSSSMKSCIVFCRRRRTVLACCLRCQHSSLCPASSFMPCLLPCLALCRAAFSFSIAVLSAMKNLAEELSDTQFCVTDILILCMKLWTVWRRM